MTDVGTFEWMTRIETKLDYLIQELEKAKKAEVKPEDGKKEEKKG